MSEEYGKDIVAVVDDEGNEHQFEILDILETDDNCYVALLPVYDDAELAVESDNELIILEVIAGEKGEEQLVQIEDEDVLESVTNQFIERLEELYEIDEIDDETASHPLS